MHTLSSQRNGSCPGECFLDWVPSSGLAEQAAVCSIYEGFRPPELDYTLQGSILINPKLTSEEGQVRTMASVTWDEGVGAPVAEPGG